MNSTEEQEDEENLCIVCAEAITIFVRPECDHSELCHICSLRLRALYKVGGRHGTAHRKNNACPICKTESPEIIYTTKKEKLFADYKKDSMKRDRKLGILFEHPSIYDETMMVLQFNCPEKGCDVVCGGGWPDLKNHVKKTHNLLLCDICTANKKVFTHEAALFTSDTLRQHIKHGDKNDTSFHGHPECGFCHSRFYTSDELFDHCRQNHETCFLCQRVGVRDQYFADYARLEAHFNSEHFPCLEQRCLEQKFVIFASDIDYQGHMLKEHGEGKFKTKGRPIVVDFNYGTLGPSSSSSSGAGRRNGRNERSRSGSNQPEEGVAMARSTSNPSTSHAPDPNAGYEQQGRRPPPGFGSQLTIVEAQTPTRKDKGKGISFAKKPAVRAPVAESLGAASFPVFGGPLPSGSTASSSQSIPEILLTPAQADAFQAGGPELMVNLQRLIGRDNNTFSQFKLDFWAFRQGHLAVEVLLENFYALALANNGKKKVEQLLTESGSVWHRLAHILPEEASDSAVQRAIEKKSKKKGLSIEEFEALKRGEPKEHAMLRVWVNHKVKIQQSISDGASQKPVANWTASAPPPPKLTKVVPAKNSRVLVIKEKKPLSANSSWGRVGGSVSPVPPSALASTASLEPQRPPDPISVPIAHARGTTSIPVTKAQFPSLPPTSKPERMTVAKLRALQLAEQGISVPDWGAPQDMFGNDEPISSTVSGKGKKKKATVLMRFG